MKKTDYERIEAVVDYLNYKSMRALAIDLGIKVQTFYDIQAGRCKISPRVAEAISDKFKNISKGWLLTGEGSMFNNQPITQSIITNNSTAVSGQHISIGRDGQQRCDHRPETLVPVIPHNIYNEANVDVLQYLRDNDVQMTPAVAQFAKTTCFYQVASNALAPHFVAGDYLALKVTSKAAPIINGDVYAIDTDDLGIILRYAYDKGDHLEMRSSVDRYETFDLPKTQILNVFRVVGLIRTNI